ncbi:FAD-dependent oxidoreductase [Candidatus Woesearchaeota archaeon]|nr:FAD-dependent oxidoreductase [Candidatus Woesearchaeota archaeon]
MADKYDVIIIGGGPAGLSAGIYCGRFKLKTLVLDEKPGGTATEAHNIENYPGFESISGVDLMERVRKHAEKEGVNIIRESVFEIKKEKVGFIVKTDDAKEFACDFVIISTGNKRQKLGIPGEKEFNGKGVSYCAACDAPFFKDKVVAVVGGGNAAVMAAVLLTNFAKKVYIIYRRDKLRAEAVWNERVENHKKVEIIYKAQVKEAKGENVLKSIVLDNGKEIETSGLFIEIGGLPSIDLAKSLGVKLDKDSKIIVTDTQRTNIKNVYGAGDITTASAGFMQIVTAMSEGSIASWDILKSKKRDAEYE